MSNFYKLSLKKLMDINIALMTLQQQSGNHIFYEFTMK